MGFAIPAQGKAMAAAFSSPHQPMLRMLSFGDSPGKVPACLLLAHPAGLGGGCHSGERGQVSMSSCTADVEHVHSATHWVVSSSDLAESGRHRATHLQSLRQSSRDLRVIAVPSCPSHHQSGNKKDIRIRTRGMRCPLRA